MGEGRGLLGVVVSFGYTFPMTPPPHLNFAPKTLNPEREFRAGVWIWRSGWGHQGPRASLPRVSSSLGFTRWKPIAPAPLSCSSERHQPRGGNWRRKRAPKNTPSTPVWAQEPTPATTRRLKNLLPPLPAQGPVAFRTDKTIPKQTKKIISMYTEFEGTFYFKVIEQLHELPAQTLTHRASPARLSPA